MFKPVTLLNAFVLVNQEAYNIRYQSLTAQYVVRLNKDMNELFHVISSIGITASLMDTETAADSGSLRDQLPTMVFTFSVGIISHAVLDYMPHTYPIKSKVDVIVSIIAVSILLILARKPYRLVVASSILGCILPDIIDIGPRMLNAYFGLAVPIHDLFFPWHWKSYSGSLYNQGYAVSAINHALVFVVLLIVFFIKRKGLAKIFSSLPS